MATARRRALPYRKGVGIALIDRRGRVFVAERLDTPGAWQMPQGGIDDGETPRAAAMRELVEETGITDARILATTPRWLKYDLPDDLQSKAWGGKFRGQQQRWYLMLFTGRDQSIDLDRHHAEFARWKWLKFDRLPMVIVGFKREIYRQVVAAFARKIESITTRPKKRRGISARGT
ncbi:MAG: RNA pyrophosphohydrolase [Alphaproteobacteria bacterium]|nr:RNA pyrophosphohydrolase [Alphaproteobacteria bacterium]